MDEMLKITIGTLSGFIVAFFAEPVKLFFQNRAKKENLRRALYHEMICNYYLIKEFVDEAVRENLNADPDEKDTKLDKFFSSLREGSDFMIRMECFQYTVQNENFTLYQLRDASLINSIYGRLKGISTWLIVEDSPKKRSKLESLIKDYLSQMDDGLKYGMFDAKTVRKILGCSVEEFLNPKAVKQEEPLKVNATRLQKWIYKLRLWYLSRR
jgi:hypothetical protein